MFCDNGLEGQQASPLYFPAEKFQADKMMEKIFWEPGLRFVFSLRSPVPQLLVQAPHELHIETWQSTPHGCSLQGLGLTMPAEGASADSPCPA